MGEGLGALASHLQEIDLQDNLIWQWSEVGTATTCTVLYCS